jgi:hypothetical protein
MLMELQIVLVRDSRRRQSSQLTRVHTWQISCVIFNNIGQSIAVHKYTSLRMLALFLLLSGAILTAGQVEEGPTPVVLWHGMGDSCCNPSSMGSIKVVNHSFPH